MRLRLPAAKPPPPPRGGLDAIRIFDDLRREAGERAALDARTAADLDLDDVFRTVDRSASAVGQQWLWARLRSPVRDAATLAVLDALASELGPAAERSAAVRRTLARLADTNSYLLPYLLFEEPPGRPRAHVLAPLLTFAAVASAFACLFVKPAVFFLAAICAINIVVRLSYRKRIAPVLHSLPALRNLIQVGLRLGREGSGLPEEARARVAALSTPMTGLLRTTSWLALETEQTNELTRMLYEYVNLVFLLDVNAFLSSLELLRRQRSGIRELFEALGEIDGALSVASFRSSLPDWCRPRLGGGGRAVRLDGGFHPLLPKAVPNSISVEGHGVLVTGSNMAGKTTFIKTVGLNALLAQTIFTCPARSFEAPWLSIASAIGRSESLTEGTSYYLAEVGRVRELVEDARDGGSHLFLLDELFRGTNTVERIAAGKAVLGHLGQGGNVVFASTHDIELVPLLAGEYRPTHFRESLVDGKLVFDFLLHPGPSSTHSAIALLAGAGFPKSLVDDALATVEVLTAGFPVDRPGR